jgi:hypothetical protein
LCTLASRLEVFPRLIAHCPVVDQVLGGGRSGAAAR